MASPSSARRARTGNDSESPRAHTAPSCGNVRSRMVNGIISTRPRTRKVLPGRRLRRTEFAGRRDRAILAKPLIFTDISPLARGLHAMTASHGLGELAVDDDRRRLGRAAGRQQGEQADGECPPDRTVAADRARARTRSRREQHREPEHHRLQGRRLGVRGISDAAARATASSRPATSALSFVQDRAHLARFQPRPDPADRQSARRRHRRRRLPGGADAARRALHPQRRAADQRHRPARDQRRRSGARRRRPDPASRAPTTTSRSTADGTITVREGANATSDSARGKLRLVQFRTACSSCRRTAPACSRARRRRAAAGADQRRASCRARSRNRTCAASSR